VLDKLLLDKGFQFRGYRKQTTKNASPPPATWFSWFVATVLYTTMPYDQSFWGLIRSPLFLMIKLVFLFPLYGVDSACVIIYWLSMQKFDEHQLVAFLVKSKSLQFVTTGLISGAIGFIKLYICTTQTDPNAHYACKNKAPGMNKTFWFEYVLFLVRVILVWTTFAMLRNFEALNEWKKKREAERHRMAAIELRALLPVKTTRIIILCSWFLTLATVWGYFHAADYFTAMKMAAKEAASQAKTALQDKDSTVDLGQSIANFHAETTKIGIHPIVAAVLVFGLLQFPTSILLNVPMLKQWPSMLSAVGAASFLSFQVYTLVNASQIDADHPEINGDEIGAISVGICLSALTTGVMVALARLQAKAKVDDEATLTRMTQVMYSLDKDGDGEVSKAEFRVAFKELFPNSKFEPVWRQIDKDGDGSLSMGELAGHFGLGHLVKETVEEAEQDESLEDMMDVERKLAESVEASALSERAGGVMSSFVFWDVFTFSIVAAYIVRLIIIAPDYYWEHEDIWRIRLPLYFSKEVLGLFSLPFLVFQVPVVKDALTHTKKTGYDRAGNCVAKLSKSESSNRYAVTQQLRMDRYHAMKNGNPTPWGEALELKWNAYLGFVTLDKKRTKLAKKKTKGNLLANEGRKSMLSINPFKGKDKGADSSQAMV